MVLITFFDGETHYISVEDALSMCVGVRAIATGTEITFKTWPWVHQDAAFPSGPGNAGNTRRGPDNLPTRNSSQVICTSVAVSGDFGGQLNV
tara:strand:+ start:451 stop:726 length:276 start_codon:yes stop_codon:yes gene_type:complete